ncbi:MAG: hypothetical protein VYE18_02360 [Pseudomonadota bacterium]|nr:hypothetical protein [Pseudomonadota bacterium]
MWPPEGQDRVWTEIPDRLIASSVIFPTGRAEAGEDGYRLSGRWPFCSGIDRSDRVMLVGSVEGSGEKRIFMVPKAELEVFDIWEVSCLYGNGSKDYAADSVFVADPMTVAAADIQSSRTPGSAVNPKPLFNLPQAGLFRHIIAAPIIGMAEGAADDFTEANRAATST